MRKVLCFIALACILAFPTAAAAQDTGERLPLWGFPTCSFRSPESQLECIAGAKATLPPCTEGAVGERLLCLEKRLLLQNAEIFALRRLFRNFTSPQPRPLIGSLQ